MGIEHCRQIFEEFPGRFIPEGAGDWNATIQFHIAGDLGGDWVVRVADGTCQVDEGTADEPSATVSTTDNTYIGMVTGKVNPMVAFSLGKVKVKGSMGDVMKLNNTSIFRK